MSNSKPKGLNLCRLGTVGDSKLIFVHKTHSVLRVVDITVGEDFLSLCDQNSVYQHWSHFQRLKCYVNRACSWCSRLYRYAILNSWCVTSRISRLISAISSALFTT